MSTELPVRVVQDPSRGFTTLPGEQTRAPDVTFSLDILHGERLQARLHGPAVPALHGTEHRACLSVRPAEVRAAAARLCRLWKELLVDFRLPDADGPAGPGAPEQPYASLVDLRDRPPEELGAILDDLCLAGSDLLFGTLLGGPDPRVQRLRAHLTDVLMDRGLRIRFDSDLYLPWPMVCLPPIEAGPDEPSSYFPLFLGYRHQIEQTGGAYPWLNDRRGAPPVPTVSLNHDTGIDRRGLTRAAEVARVLAKDTRFVERTTRRQLVRDLADRTLCEHLMYFWCHGRFVPNGSQPAVLALKLTDEPAFDGQTVHERRHRFGEESLFEPFVLLNACHAGVPEGGGDLAFLSRALIKAGARGVLGPQIEMPQMFAAEYALEFLTRYLRGTETAGVIAHAVARRFADELHNPLGFTYALHCGMDTRLERADLPAADSGTGQEITV